MTIHTPVQETEGNVAINPDVKVKSRVRMQGIAMLLVGVFFTLFTYQYFHHGLWGKLNNYNKKPMVTLQGTTIKNNQLNLALYRPNGPDTYGSFVEKVAVSVPGTANPVETWTPTVLAKVSKGDITNISKFQHVHTGPWGLIVPLAAKAKVDLPLNAAAQSAVQKAGQAVVTVQDVSGAKWTVSAAVK
ncbi:TQO small subunit DoxA domain-containing protein [Alicyclobacillus sp. SO9]|uniref:TQO small subunit DoxA domain-containing protein n=1 Tax=Alicyclobacillus sp. SO9 TaxID=2665646 RepID=UPI0018E817C6|nr:TQO small subunit DoxA domain-containing protein [Alicyclobacillus sp. SO9]QQE79253.1 hypothetical protein GI364_01705 [Alicyclobacillus sp. SO9]